MSNTPRRNSDTSFFIIPFSLRVVIYSAMPIDQLMVDNPDYSSLKPDPGAKTKKRKLRKVLKDDDNDDDDEDFNEELRVCPTCEELLVRQLSKVISQGKTILSALYEKMQLAMRDADRLKPDYLEMADSLL